MMSRPDSTVTAPSRTGTVTRNYDHGSRPSLPVAQPGSPAAARRQLEPPSETRACRPRTGPGRRGSESDADSESLRVSTSRPGQAKVGFGLGPRTRHGPRHSAARQLPAGGCPAPGPDPALHPAVAGPFHHQCRGKLPPSTTRSLVTPAAGGPAPGRGFRALQSEAASGQCLRV